jgi:hypothetical protein
MHAEQLLRLTASPAAPEQAPPYNRSPDETRQAPHFRAGLLCSAKDIPAYKIVPGSEGDTAP